MIYSKCMHSWAKKHSLRIITKRITVYLVIEIHEEKPSRSLHTPLSFSRSAVAVGRNTQLPIFIEGKTPPHPIPMMYPHSIAWRPAIDLQLYIHTCKFMSARRYILIFYSHPRYVAPVDLLNLSNWAIGAVPATSIFIDLCDPTYKLVGEHKK